MLVSPARRDEGHSRTLRLTSACDCQRAHLVNTYLHAISTLVRLIAKRPSRTYRRVAHRRGSHALTASLQRPGASERKTAGSSAGCLLAVCCVVHVHSATSQSVPPPS